MAKSRGWRWAGLILLVAVIGVGAWAFSRVGPYARIGAAYVAKQYCSCLFVTGRSETSCRAEFKPDIDKFSVSVDRAGLPASAKVTTRLLMFTGEARYADGFGCTVSR